VSLRDCGQLNVLIGKNNAGKSNVLSTIDLVLEHLKRGAVAAAWPTARPKDEFTDRVPSDPAQIGIEFALPAPINAALRERLAKEAPHLEKSIAQIEASPSIVFIVACAVGKSRSFMFTEQIGVGTIDATADALGLAGMSLLRVDRAVGRELFEI